MPATNSGVSSPNSKRSTQIREDAWREPQRIPLQPAQPHMNTPQARQPRPQKNPHEGRQSSYEPFSQDQIKIPYTNYQRAGPHNQKPAASKPTDHSEPYSKKQMDKLRADYEKQQEEKRDRTQREGRPRRQSIQQRDGSRKRSGSITRFFNWMDRKLTGSETARKSRRPSTSSQTRPATANSQAPSIKTPAPVAFSHAPKKNSHGKPPLAASILPFMAPQTPQDHRPTGYVNVPQHQEQKPAGFDYSKNRDTSGTTWSNFLELSNKKAATDFKPPPVPTRPTDYTPTPLPGNPTAFVPSITKPTTIPARKPVPTSTHASPHASLQSTTTTATASSHHSKKPSASKLMDKLAHPLQRQPSDVSELSFFCSGVEDEALEVTSKKRADIIQRQKADRKEADKRAEHDEQERLKNNTVFAKALQRDQAQKDLELAQAEEKLERRLRQSIHGKKTKIGALCCVCDEHAPMANVEVCRKCADKYPGLADRRVSKAVGQDLTSLTGPMRPASTASTVFDVDLTNYTGPFARPPSSIYPSDSRPISGYTIGNPYSDAKEKTAPPMPAVPEHYKKPVGYRRMADGETRDTAFYEEINEVTRMYDSGVPQTPMVPKKWRSARASGIY